MKAWEATAWLCAAVVLTQSALELREAYQNRPKAPVEVHKPAQAGVYTGTLWQDPNSASVSACKGLVAAIAAEAGLTVQDMAVEPVKGLVARANRDCIIKNGLSV